LRGQGEAFGPKLETQRAKPGLWVLGEGAYRCSPPARRFAGALSFSSGIWGEALAAKNFGAFWVLYVNFPAVRTAIQNCVYMGVRFKTLTWLV